MVVLRQQLVEVVVAKVVLMVGLVTRMDHRRQLLGEEEEKEEKEGMEEVQLVVVVVGDFRGEQRMLVWVVRRRV